jgi:CBS domain-containing protein
VRAIEAIRKPPATTAPDTTIREAAKQMDTAAVGALVVVDDGHPIGIVTDRDLVVRALARGVPPDARVDSVMTPGVVALEADVDLRESLKIFHSHAIRRLPLVEEGEIVGVISADDLLIDLVSDIGDLVRPITGQVIFGGPEPERAPLPA